LEDIEALASQANPSGDIPLELARFEAALAASVEQLGDLRDSASSSDIRDVAMIFQPTSSCSKTAASPTKCGDAFRMVSPPSSRSNR